MSLAGLLVGLSVAAVPIRAGPLPWTPKDPVVLITTSEGQISAELSIANAPVTVCNFLRYVQEGAYAGGDFFRTVRTSAAASPAGIDVVQARARQAGRSPHPPIPLEPTSQSMLSHHPGTLSMARSGPDTAQSDFFIVVRGGANLDFGGSRNPDGQGFAAFGKVTRGMSIVRKIQGLPAVHELLSAPVKIRHVRVVGPASGFAPLCSTILSKNLGKPVDEGGER